MIFLLTNDDGINSERLIYTKSVLEKFGEVYLVAPSVEQSAKSMSLSIRPINYKKIDEKTYSVEGTPVDCVNLALGGLGLRPDVVFSGVNKGYNLGFDTRYSGTVGACLQAQYFGLNSVALSADRCGEELYKKELEETVKYILDNKLYNDSYTLNVNFAREEFMKSKGIIEGEIEYHQYDYNPIMTEETYYGNRGSIKQRNDRTDTDIYAYLNGYTSITKIKA